MRNYICGTRATKGLDVLHWACTLGPNGLASLTSIINGCRNAVRV